MELFICMFRDSFQGTLRAALIYDLELLSSWYREQQYCSPLDPVIQCSSELELEASHKLLVSTNSESDSSKWPVTSPRLRQQ